MDRLSSGLIDITAQNLKIDVTTKDEFFDQFKTIIDEEDNEALEILRLLSYDEIKKRILRQEMKMVLGKVFDEIKNDTQGNILLKFDRYFNKYALELVQDKSIIAYSFVDACFSSVRAKLEILALEQNKYADSKYDKVVKIEPVHAYNFTKQGLSLISFCGNDVRIVKHIKAQDFVKNIDLFVQSEFNQSKPKGYQIGLDILLSDEIVKSDAIDFIYIDFNRLILTNSNAKLGFLSSVYELYPDKKVMVKLSCIETLLQHRGYEATNNTCALAWEKAYEVVIDELLACAKVFEKNELMIVAPHTSDGQHYRDIKARLQNYMDDKKVLIGIAIDDEITVENLNDYQKFDYATFEFDALMDEYLGFVDGRDDVFRKFFRNELSLIHYGVQRKRRDDFAILGTIANEQIMKRSIKGGIRGFIVSAQKLPELVECINDFDKQKRSK